MKKISRFIAYHPKLIVLIATLLIIPSVLGYMGTKINYDILTYLPENLESVQGEQILDKDFNDAAIALLVIDDYTPVEASDLKENISQIDGVKQVLWTDSIIDISIPQEIMPDVLKSTFYSDDGKSTLMLVQFSQSGSSETTMAAIKQIKSIMTKNCFISGLSVLGVETKDMVEQQTPFFTCIAIALALLVLAFTTKSFMLPILLLISLGYAVVFNMGTNLFLGEISYITQCVAVILQLGITMDYSVFLNDRFEEEKLKYPNKKDAMASAIESTFVSLLGSSLTTAFGFLALCFMSFTLGMDLGIVMIKGVLFGILSVVTVLPSFLLIFDKPINKLSHKSIVPNFNRLNTFLVKHNKVFTVIFILLFIPAFILSENVNVYYNMTKALPQEADGVVALDKVKTEFNMATTHFIIVKDSLPAEDMENMLNEITQVDGISEAMGLNSFIGAMIPSKILPDAVKKICISGGYQLVMANTGYVASTDEENAQIDQIYQIVKKYDPDGYLTGEGVMTKDLIEVTSRDFKVTSLISIVAIFILIAICFKSFSLPVLLVASIELAIMLNKACSCVMGSEMIFVAPTIIGCVQLGATVDYAILLATRYKEELRKTLDKTKAAITAANGACVSIIQSALVFFAATFGVYLTCDISIVKSICALLARGSVISAIVIIFLLTPMLTCFNSVIEKTSLKWPKVIKNKKEDNIS